MEIKINPIFYGGILIFYIGVYLFKFIESQYYIFMWIPICIGASLTFRSLEIKKQNNKVNK